MTLGIRWGSLRGKIIAWSFVPTALVLVTVALVSLQALQGLALDLVVDRDREVAQLRAALLSTELIGYASRLQAAVSADDVAGGRSSAQALFAGKLPDALAVFDGGLLLLDRQGRVLATRPPDLVSAGTDWSGRDFVSRCLASGRPEFSSVDPAGPDGKREVHVSAPVTDYAGTVQGLAVGAMVADPSKETEFGTVLGQLPSGENAAIIVVDSHGGDVYGTEASLGAVGLASRPEVQAALAGQSGALRTRDSAGHEILTAYAPIPETGWALVTTQSWSQVTAAIRRYGQAVLVLLALGLLVPAIVVGVGVRRITDPVNQLILAAQEVAKGRFGRTISADSGDEIQELAQQFNRMSAELDSSYRNLEKRVEQRTEELERRNQAERRRSEQFRAIAEVSRRMTSILPLDDLLEEIVQVIQEAFGYDHVGVGLVEAGEVTYRAGAGPMWGREPMEPIRFQPNRMKVGADGISGWVAEAGEPVLVPDVTKEPRYLHLEGSQTRSELAVPIIAKSEVIGVLDAQSRSVGSFDTTDVMVLQALANQAGVAIDNARLYERARKAAVLEERQRVARDLHDSVTQSLYGVTLYGDAAARLLEAGDLEGVTEYLSQLRQTAKEALAEMRLLIFELRPAELEKIGLIGALQARLDAVETRAGLSTALDADPALRAPLGVEDALYRIAQEALNNALRHAQARTVRLSVQRTDGTIVMEVADDGRGFDPASTAGGGGIGLHTMVERAEQVGGQTRIDSQPGSGTRVRVEVPL